MMYLSLLAVVLGLIGVALTADHSTSFHDPFLRLNSLILRRFGTEVLLKTEGTASGFNVGFEGPNPLITGWM